MGSRVDPDLARILPLLPLRDAANLTPLRARNDLVALADSRKDVPLPLLLAIADTSESDVRASLTDLQAAEFLY